MDPLLLGKLEALRQLGAHYPMNIPLLPLPKGRDMLVVRGDMNYISHFPSPWFAQR